MAKKYQVTPVIRFFNRMMKFITRLGFGPQQTYILTVPGRKSGRLYSTPVSLVEVGSKRWLVSPYGEVSWVKNARAAGQVILSRGGKEETVAIVELGPEESAPVLKKYIAQEPITRPYFDAEPDASVEVFATEARQHPVFLLRGK